MESSQLGSLTTQSTKEKRRKECEKARSAVATAVQREQRLNKHCRTHDRARCAACAGSQQTP